MSKHVINLFITHVQYIFVYMQTVLWKPLVFLFLSQYVPHITDPIIAFIGFIYTRKHIKEISCSVCTFIMAF